MFWLVATALTICFMASSPPVVAQGETGFVYLMRRTGYTGALDGYSIFMDGGRICVLNNKRYSKHEVSVGEHEFTVRFDGKGEKEKSERLKVLVEAGREHFIVVEQRSGFTVKVTLQELAGSSGRNALEELKEDPECK